MEVEELTRLRVMIAEDHKDMLEVMIRVLGKEHEVVGIARNGRDLVDMAVVLNPDVIVSDIFMPKLSGLQASRELSLRGLEIPFLFVSSNPEIVKRRLYSIIDKMDAGSELVPAVEAVAAGKKYISRSLHPQSRDK